MKWETVIGLEIHVQLNTRSKIFSGASTKFGGEPNTQAGIVDMGYPGALPTLNREVVRKAIKLGLALDATINRRNAFDRKNYFYPDLPKNYQTSQLAHPIVEWGKLDIVAGDVVKTINVTRAHMEEDAGKSVHEGLGDMTGIDLNRTGTPLVEVVSEPEMRSAAEAVAYAKALRDLVVWLDVCDGDMSQGSFRVDANVSVRPEGQSEFGKRVEIKNLNSFRFMEQAIDYEVERQIDLISDGGEVVQETRLFDPDKGETRSMRSKEDAHDYRYFPCPDLPPVVIDDEMMESVRSSMPELPKEMAKRFMTQYGLGEYDARQMTSSKDWAAYFEAAAKGPEDAKVVANWMTGEIASRLNRSGEDIGACPVEPERLAGMVARIIDGTISSALAKRVFDAMWEGPVDADAVIKAQGLEQISDEGEIERMVDAAIAANQKSVDEYKAGKDRALNALLGQVMKASKGKANPAKVKEIMLRKLSK